jgi:hypothetical protein
MDFLLSCCTTCEPDAFASALMSPTVHSSSHREREGRCVCMFCAGSVNALGERSTSREAAAVSGGWWWGHRHNTQQGQDSTQQSTRTHSAQKNGWHRRGRRNERESMDDSAKEGHMARNKGHAGHILVIALQLCIVCKRGSTYGTVQYKYLSDVVITVNTTSRVQSGGGEGEQESERRGEESGGQPPTTFFYFYF